MAGALSAPGPGRFAAADAVVRADPVVATGDGESVDVAPAPLLDAALCARRGVRRRRRRRRLLPGRRVDAAGRAGRRRADAHGWASAALTPYTLQPGRAPGGRTSRRRRAARRRAGSRADRDARGRGDLPRHRHRPRRRRPADALLRRHRRARLSGAPGKVNAIAVLAAPGVTRRAAPDAPSARRVEVLDRAHAADADAGDPRAADRVALVAIFGDDGRDRRRASRCSSSPARSRWRSSSAGARSRCCARSAPRRTRSGG